MDFAELQSFFEKHNIHFVSVTQNIDTSSSSGRMLLNVLVIFAAFERDLIIERTRTAVSGGKKRGKFCGGVPMIGY
ncbi:MAG: recombinase family protein, partial [Lentisphaeria bacterium]|nr:recombinase family protein [Lentisphaeria bacterium]